MKGFTIIELLLVIGLVGLLTGVTSPILSANVQRSNWQTTTDRVSSQLWKAQSYAVEGKSISGSVVWGVCVTGSILRLFNGSCGSPVFKEDYQIPPGVSVTGLSGVTFDNLRGEPSAATTVVVGSGLGSNTITVNPVGLIGIN